MKGRTSLRKRTGRPIRLRRKRRSRSRTTKIIVTRNLQISVSRGDLSLGSPSSGWRLPWLVMHLSLLCKVALKRCVKLFLQLPKPIQLLIQLWLLVLIIDHTRILDIIKLLLALNGY